MATTLWRPKGQQFFDGNGDPLAGGKIKYERAGTSTLLTTYSDQAGTVPNTQTSNRIVLDSAGRLEEPIYIDDSFDAKETLYTSADVIVDPWPFDDIPKAVDLTASLSNFAKPTTEWTTDTAATVNLTAGNMGEGRLADTSSNDITYNLPSASDAGNGRGIVVNKTSASNNVTLDGDGSETIGGSTTYTFSSGSVHVISDGANWRIVHEAEALVANVTDDLTAGFTSASQDQGTKSSGTFTPAFATGTVQHCTNGGAFTLAPPSTGNGTMILDIANNASAGAITTSSWDVVTGDAFTTTNGDDFRCYISVGDAGSHLHVVAF